MLLAGQLNPDPRASFVVPPTLKLRLSPVCSAFEMSSNLFLSCWDPVIIPPTGNVFGRWQEYGIFPSPPLPLPLCPISQEPASTKSCRGADLKAWLCVNPCALLPQPLLCSKMWCFLGSKKVLFFFFFFLNIRVKSNSKGVLKVGQEGGRPVPHQSLPLMSTF